MRSIAAPGALALALALAGGCSTSLPQSAPAAGLASTTPAGRCAAMAQVNLGGTLEQARYVEAAEGLPAHCEITATLRPVAGSNIGVLYRLPDKWNGRVLGIGGGAWLGNTTLAAARDGLGKGYATLQTNGGHTSTLPWGNEWTGNPVQAEDFSHRAIHEMTVSGKRAATIYYRRNPEFAVYSGCSTGGRMGLMEAQRYPDDYDAIIAGAPVYTLQVQTGSVLRNQTFARDGGAAGLGAGQLQMVQGAVIARCDQADGLADGLINDPASCRFDPAELQCRAGQDENCLSAPQVAGLRAAYDGIRASDGSFAMHPLRRGGESAWGGFVRADGAGQAADPSRGGGLMGLAPVIFGERPVDWAAFSDADYLTVRRSAFAAKYEAASADLGEFFRRGGRLMLWHGENDAGPSPVLSQEYAEAVIAQNRAAAGQFRYFTLPGVGHCAGGPGADQVDYLAAMEEWIASDQAPERLIGTRADRALVRPHCAWPQVARYRGAGEPNDPANWQCSAGQS